MNADEKLYEDIGAFFGARMAELDKKLSARIDALETAPPFRDAGTWKSGQTYGRGQACTYAGGLWIAQQDYPGTPGKGENNGWRLASKSGGTRRKRR